MMGILFLIGFIIIFIGFVWFMHLWQQPYKPSKKEKIGAENIQWGTIGMDWLCVIADLSDFGEPKHTKFLRNDVNISNSDIDPDNFYLVSEVNRFGITIKRDVKYDGRHLLDQNEIQGAPV